MFRELKVKHCCLFFAPVLEDVEHKCESVSRHISSNQGRDPVWLSNIRQGILHTEHEDEEIFNPKKKKILTRLIYFGSTLN